MNSLMERTRIRWRWWWSRRRSRWTTLSSFL